MCLCNIARDPVYHAIFQRHSHSASFSACLSSPAINWSATRHLVYSSEWLLLVKLNGKSC